MSSTSSASGAKQYLVTALTESTRVMKRKVSAANSREAAKKFAEFAFPLASVTVSNKVKPKEVGKWEIYFLESGNGVMGSVVLRVSAAEPDKEDLLWPVMEEPNATA